MSSTTWNVSKDALVANTSGGTALGAGKDDHLCVGYNSYLPGSVRSLLGFSYSFTGFTAINSAVLHIQTSSGSHTPTASDPDLYIDLITASWSEGTYGADEVWYNANSVNWDNQPACSSANRVTWNVGGASAAADNTWYTVDITAMVRQAWANGAFYGIRLMSSSEGSTAERAEFWSREKGSTYDAYIVVDYSTNTAPNAPTSLSPTGDAIVNTLTPTFAGTFSDPDAGDSLSGAQVVVYADDGTTQVWDSGSLAKSGAIFSVTYAGSALAGNTFYRWKGRTKDAAGAWGAYSALQRFKVNSVPSAPTISLQQTPTTDIQTLTPTFQLTHNDPDATDTNAYKYRIVLETSAGVSVWDSGDVTLGTVAHSISVTYAGPALSWQTGYRWKARTQDSNGAWSGYSGYATFTTHTTGVPTGLDPTGDEVASSLTPTFVGSRAGSTDSLASAQVQVYQDDGTTLVWDSGTFTTGVSSTDFSKAYAGAALSSATFYRWRARVTGAIGGTSSYSGLSRFKTPDTNTPNGTSPVGTKVTPVTNLGFTFTRTANFNRHEFYLYQSDGVTQVTSDTPVAYAATASKTFTYSGTLSYGTTYKWKVRVSSDGGSTWSPFTGLIQFTTDSAGVPTLAAPINDSWQTTVTPTLQGTTYNSETISTYRILLYASDQTTLIWDSGDLSGSSTSFSKVYNGSTALTKGSRYFWQASYKKTGGIPGGYSALASFHVNADPNAPTNRTPATGYVYADDATPIAPRFTCDFSDSDLDAWGDYPTKLEVEVSRNSDSVVMYTLSRTTNLGGGSNNIADGDAGVAKTNGAGGANLSAEIEYRWRARYTDSKAVAGSWSSYNVFKPSQAPTTTITAPGATVNSPSFAITWTYSSPGSKAKAAYRVRVVRAADAVSVYDTGKVYSTVTTFTLPAGYLVNGTGYEVRVTSWDIDDLPSAEASASTTTNWTAPDPPADFTADDDQVTSTILLEWTASNLAGSDFSYYQVYRRIASDTSWTKVAAIASQSVTTYKDYYAANGTMYDYKVTVFKKVPGDADLESPDSDLASVVLDADMWFVIGNDRAADHCFELPTTRAPYREPIQQEVFEPLRGSTAKARKTVVRGRVLGAEGSLECMWDESEVADAKRRIAYIRDNAGPHILKSPFGDLWEVEFSGPENDPQPVGHLRVALAWTEIA